MLANPGRPGHRRRPEVRSGWKATDTFRPPLASMLLARPDLEIVFVNVYAYLARHAPRVADPDGLGNYLFSLVFSRRVAPGIRFLVVSG